VLSLHTDFNPQASSLGLDFEPYSEGLYDEVVGPVCGRKWSRSPLPSIPNTRIPIHEIPADYLSFEAVLIFEAEEDEGLNLDFEAENCSGNEVCVVDKYELMARRYEALGYNVYLDDLDYHEKRSYSQVAVDRVNDIDEDIVGKSFPRCEGVGKAACIVTGGVLRREGRRAYCKRGRRQIYFRTAFV